jgi:hypothetical protein
MFPRHCALLAMACLALHARGQALDPLISSPALWQTPRADFVQQHRDLGFYWLSSSQDRAETHSKRVTLFSQRVYEVDAEFQADKLSALTIFIYNRGDAGDLTRDQLTALMAHSVDQLHTLTGVQPVFRGQEASDAVKAQAFQCQTPASTFLLEYSFTKEVKSWNIPFRAEFVRLRVTPTGKPKSFLAEALASASAQAPFDGPSHVKKDPSGDVRIDTVPMVDQGEKGYCVVATAERVMRYYGVPVDEHEMAELANTSATQGTSSDAMFDSLEKLSQRLRVKIRPVQRMDVRGILDLLNQYNLRARREHEPEIPDQGLLLDVQKIYSLMQPDILKEVRTHNKADVDRFQQMVQDHIDQGIPVLWTVMLGLMPEAKMPRVVGGHMRLIIGYNTDTNEILYSDPWGPGNELKRMPADNAWTMTLAMDTIEPL